MKLSRRLMLAAPLFATAARAAEQPVKLQSRVAELFVDDELIAQQQGLKRTLRPPKKDGAGNQPLIALEDEFGGQPATLEANGTIVWDPLLKRYVMFALAFCPTYTGPSADKTRLYRFTSADGLNWVRGDDGKPQRIAFDLLDRVSGRSATYVDLFSCCYNERDSEFPYQGWLWFANWGVGREGAYFVRCRDGKTWERGRMIVPGNGRQIRQDGRILSGGGDVTIFSHDPQQNRFLAIVKFASPVAVGPGNRLRARSYVYADRLDVPLDMQRIERVELVPAAADANGDAPWDEYYASTAWRVGSQWLGGVKIWHGGGDYPHSAAGSAYLKLVSSRDGLHWKKVAYANESGTPEVWLPNGAEGGNGGRNDGGYVTEFSQGPLRIKDELVYYYGCSSYGKNKPRGVRVTGGGIFRARIRLDGFVSVDGGSLTTKLLSLEGRGIQVNAAGPVTVEVLDPSGKARGKSILKGDSLRHRVAGAGLRKGSVRFTVAPGGSLYSFTLRDGG